MAARLAYPLRHCGNGGLDPLQLGLLLVVQVELGASDQKLERLVFFFQAEAGIRYLTVTGVQTCALPISAIVLLAGTPMRQDGAAGAKQKAMKWQRSEERRVGKECRSRGSPYH